VLEAEVRGLAPGRVLEVGCGDGADAAWLAGMGWQVTAMDISQVALDHAAARAEEQGVTVEWVCGAFEDSTVGAGAFDLVLTMYPALRHGPDGKVVESLMDAVAIGGALLIVHHAVPDPETARSQGFDPADYVRPADVAARLGDDWKIEANATRIRSVAPSHGPPHALETVLKAIRLK